MLYRFGFHLAALTIFIVKVSLRPALTALAFLVTAFLALIPAVLGVAVYFTFTPFIIASTLVEAAFGVRARRLAGALGPMIGVMAATTSIVAGRRTTWDPALDYQMLAMAGVTSAIDFGGTPETLIDGIQRKGAGLNIGGLYIFRPGETIPKDDPSPNEVSDLVADALKRGALGVKMPGGYHPSHLRSPPTSSPHVINRAPTSAFTSAQKSPVAG